MGKITGDISVMPLTDVMQWVDMSKKSGVLTLANKKVSRTIFMQDGNIIFASSNQSGSRLGEFLVTSRLLKEDQLKSALHESRKMQIPFTAYLILKEILTQTTLERIITRFVEAIFIDVLKWQGGSFEFVDDLPFEVHNGPVKVSVSSLLFNSVKVHDESEKDKKADFDSIMQEIARKLESGDIEIPPLPDMLMRINEAVSREVPTAQIAKIIMSDQILTTKILRVVNSSYYSPPQKINSVRQAAVFMGFKSILSIVTAHVLGGSQAKNSEEMKGILRHSLLCAFICRKIAQELQLDQEELFVCGLLHDIGKTVLLNLLNNRKLGDDEKKEIIANYHASAGHTLAAKWQLSDTVCTVARYHHAPGQAGAHRDIVEVVFLANTIANNSDNPDAFPEEFTAITMDDIDMRSLLKDLEGIKEAVNSMI